MLYDENQYVNMTEIKTDLIKLLLFLKSLQGN